MAEKKCESCICESCKYKNTNDCAHTDLCVDCGQRYVTAACPFWECVDDGRE